MAVKKHIHTLRKVRKQKSLTFQCNDPQCTWKQPALLIEGKEFKCNYCNNRFIYTPSMSRMRFPHCPDCTAGRVKDPITVKEFRDKEIKQNAIFEELLGGMKID